MLGTQVNAPRTYDVHAANHLLPEVRRLVAQVVEIGGQLPELQDQLRIAEYRMRRPDAMLEEADRFERASVTVSAAERDLKSALHSLSTLDVHLKDARLGLVDFLSLRDGEVVELCWRLGEDQIEHWHPIGEGFAGRRRL